MINGIITAAKVVMALFVLGIALMFIIMGAAYGSQKADEVHTEIEQGQ